MKKLVRVILLDEAKQIFQSLNKIVLKQIAEGKTSSKETRLLRSIKQKVGLLKQNPFYGNNIPKLLIPKKYSVQNLWRVELANFWRMLYTIKGDKIEVICFIVEILNHKNYDALFGYKRK